jgi:hypothetical protein
MKIRILSIIVSAAIASTFCVAQTTQNTLLDLQTSPTIFFDPTAEKEATPYTFSAPWRIEAGYVQLNHRTQDTSALYLHGLRVGATVDFVLPHNFSIQTGALATLAYGINKQHWPSISTNPNGSMDYENAQVNSLQHNILQLQLTIPVRAYYNINVWKKLNIFFYAGPQLNVGLMHYDVLKPQVAPSTLEWMEQQGMFTTSHDRYMTKELYRTNIQFGLGGGLEWDRYRLQAGYDFGLNNILRSPIADSYKRYEWGWMATFSYKL